MDYDWMDFGEMDRDTVDMLYENRDLWDDDDRAYDRWVDECMNLGIDPMSPLADYQIEVAYELPSGLMLDDDYEMEDEIDF